VARRRWHFIQALARAGTTWKHFAVSWHCKGVPEPPIDPLVLGQRVVGILETGRRTATYKLAVLSALIDYCVEHLPETSRAPLDVPLDELADRVIELYWRQVVPFESLKHRLYQSTGEKSGDRALILDEIAQLRSGPGKHVRRTPAVARKRARTEYENARSRIVHVLVRQPLHRLQKLTGKDEQSAFLYDDSWMHDRISKREIDKRGNKIQLKAGVATGLAGFRPGAAWPRSHRRPRPRCPAGEYPADTAAGGPPPGRA